MWKGAVILGVIGVFFVFSFFVSQTNYKKHREIKFELVEHPENLPKPEVAARTTFGFSNVIADMYWLQTIQYIGGNAVSSAYKKYLYAILDLVTTLNPYFEHPYIIGLLLLPGHNDIYENLGEEEQKAYTLQAEKIGLKGIDTFCDMEKIKLIDKEFDLIKIWNDDIYKNPCKSDMVPYSLAFVYYYYLNQPLEAAKYYKIASAIDGSIEGAKIMSAIMQGKGGEREKAIYMFLNMGRNIEEDQACNNLSSEIENIMNGLSSGELRITGELIRTIGVIRNETFGEFSEETKEKATSDTSCQNYVNKAIRELNMLYLDLANQKHIEEKGSPAEDSRELLEAGYIDYEPVDFQQYEDYGIQYKYNENVGNFDYSNAGF